MSRSNWVKHFCFSKQHLEQRNFEFSIVFPVNDNFPDCNIQILTIQYSNIISRKLIRILH